MSDVLASCPVRLVSDIAPTHHANTSVVHTCSAAAASEADIRPPAEEVVGDESATKAEAAPEIRPEDQAPKQKISNDMKDRLRKELTSQGADPNKSAGNPILVVAAVIAVLVVVGGQGQPFKVIVLCYRCILLVCCIVAVYYLYCCNVDA